VTCTPTRPRQSHRLRACLHPAPTRGDGLTRCTTETTEEDLLVNFLATYWLWISPIGGTRLIHLSLGGHGGCGGGHAGQDNDDELSGHMHNNPEHSEQSPACPGRHRHYANPLSVRLSRDAIGD
jgi:hypothetical protein